MVVVVVALVDVLEVVAFVDDLVVVGGADDVVPRAMVVTRTDVIAGV